MKTVATPFASATLDDLELREDTELLNLAHSLPRGSSTRDRVCEVLVTRYRPLVRSCVQRYRNSAESPEELMQVGYVGLLKAINNFDPAVGTSLAGYAQPCVSGEIKRHFRDKRWQVRVQRSLQELRLELRAAAAALTSELGRSPVDAELATRLEVTAEDVRAVRQAELAFQAASLDSPIGGEDGTASLGDLLGEDDPQLEHLIDMQAVWAHWGDLPEREQRLLLMRFYGNMTQAEIGDRLGISQMHVSRLLAGALRFLRERLVEADPAPVQVSA
jgi:RNA polymerase sigma-B factor